MIDVFIDFCQKIFPSIDPYTAESAKKAINEYRDVCNHTSLTIQHQKNICLQGDIFSDLPYCMIEEESGEPITIMSKVQLLSNTCDATREDQIIFAPIFPISEIDSKKLPGIKNNTVYNMFYIPDSLIRDYVIDFSLMFSYPRNIFEKYLSLKKVNRIASLSNIGYYMFLCKLTVFLMRPEDIGANNLR